MDQGLDGGLIGGDVQFMADSATGWISSMAAPILKDWSGLDRHELAGGVPNVDEANRLMERVRGYRV